MAGRAALLEALQLQSVDWFELPGADSSTIAATTGPGFQRCCPADFEPRLPDIEAPVQGTASAAGSRILPQRMPAAWVVTSRRENADELPPGPDAPPGDLVDKKLSPGGAERPLKAEAMEAINSQQRLMVGQTWARLGNRLRRALDPQGDTPLHQPIDWQSVVRRLARGQSIWPLPHRGRPRWPGGCIVLLDALAPSVVPLRDEMDAIASRLRRSVGGAVPVLEFAESGPQLPLKAWKRDYSLRHLRHARRQPYIEQPPWHRWHGQTVLLVSDLAAHDRDAGRRRNWQALLLKARHNGVHLQALVPVATPGLAQLPRGLHWAPWPDFQRGRHLPPLDAVTKVDAPSSAQPAIPKVKSDQAAAVETAGPVIDTLLALLAMCGNVNAVLLRSLVCLVVAGRAQTAWLWRLWNHDHVERLLGGSCRLLPDRAEPHQHRVQYLPTTLALDAFRMRRTFAAALNDADEHGAVLRAASLAPQLTDLVHAELVDAQKFVNEIWLWQLYDAPADQRSHMSAGVAIWVEQALSPVRLAHRHAIRQLLAVAHAPALARGEKVRHYEEIGIVRARVGVDVDVPLVRCAVLQEEGGLWLHVIPEEEHSLQTPGLRLVSVGPFRKDEGVTIIIEDSARWLSLNQPRILVAHQDNGQSDVQLGLGSCELSIRAVHRPRGVSGWRVEGGQAEVNIDLPWASTVSIPWPLKASTNQICGQFVGFDEFGSYLDLALPEGASQRFRYIEPGSFWMGSFESEQDRRSEEGPRHRVTLTCGYWVADSPCTQALWREVLGSNPSRFGDQLDSPLRPVEQVTWHMVQKFLAAMKRHIPDGCEVGLPTEAQWEYATRAGSDSAYWWGDEADGKNANLGGAATSTTKVKRYPANPWGLYDLHGNVWEWCDGSPRLYENREVIAPLDGQDREWGVLRGGAWDSSAGGARSAFRLRIPRDGSLHSSSFRLVLRSASLPSGEVTANPQMAPGRVSVASRSTESPQTGISDRIKRLEHRLYGGGRKKK